MAVAIQSSWFKAHMPYLLGAALLHVFVAGLFALTMIQMQRNTPPPQLAIQAVIIDPKALSRPSRKAQQEAARKKEEQAAAERKKQEEEAAAKREQEERAEQERQAKEREQEKEQQERLVREREEQEKVAKEKAAEEQRQQEAERQKKVEAERQQKAEAERKRVAEIERKQREREAADAKARQQQLNDQIAEEEALTKARSSGAMSQYQAMLQQHIERQWIKPGSAKPGINCKLSVTQSPSGSVLSVKVTQCNGDAAVVQSIENAVQRANPLPLPSDMRLFERNLNITFQPED